MLTDLLLAIAHHLLVFALLAVLVMELMLVRPGMTTAQVLRAGRLDIAYGAIAGLIIVIGFSRVFFGAKPAEFYLTSSSFWAKIAAFALIGILSVPPTLKLLRWRRAAEKDPAYRPSDAEIASVRRLMHWEAVVIIPILVFAAMMARGYSL